MSKAKGRFGSFYGERRWTMQEIKACNKARGHHWFEPGTMRFFASRVGNDVYQGPGGIYFISSERFMDDPRRYSVRRFNPKDCSVDTEFEFQQFPSRGSAVRAAKRLARGGRG